MAAKKKTVKCRSKYCRHRTRTLMRTKAVQVGNAYYHADCYRDLQNCKAIIDLFRERVDPYVTMALLRKVVDTLVYEKNVCSDYLLFALRYCVSHDVNLKHPQGLYLIVQDPTIQREYLRKEDEKKRKLFRNMLMDDDNSESFDHKPERPMSFEDIITR